MLEPEPARGDEPEVTVRSPVARRSLWLAAALSLAITTGCATTGDVEKVEARVISLEKYNATLKQTMAEDVQRLEKLRGMITEAEESLRKNGANLGIRLERVEETLPKVVGTQEALQVQLRRLEADVATIKRVLAERLGTTEFFLPPDLPKDKDGMWAAAEAAGKVKNVKEAQAIYELYAASFPDDVRAPAAFFAIAKVMEGAGDPEEAIRFYQRVFDKYRQSPLAPQAVMRIAEIYTAKGDCGRAKSIYKFVGDEFKGTADGDEAKKRAKDLAKSKDCKK